MKFGHTFNETLSSENFPLEWQAAAIQYRQLKKCIKRLQRELSELGLNVDTLKALISESESRGSHGAELHFQPKLVLTVHGRDGLQLDLGLSEETRRSLERLLQTRNRRASTASDLTCSSDDTASETTSETASETFSTVDSDGAKQKAQEPVSTIEIPLNNDTEFFHTLTSELSALDQVQSSAAKTIENEIVTIGNSVIAVATPMSLVSRSDLYPWREIFRVYLEMGIFFSNLEIEAHKERNVDDAQARLDKFLNEVERLGLRKSFKHKNSGVLFRRFFGVNEEVLRVLRFQAINKMAMMKILKKFDKRTAFGARQTFPMFVATTPFLAAHLAKAICFTMSSKLLTIIPQLDDYLCPICQSISIKPVRLSCSHVFCVRCLVKLQREAKRFCPMCRCDVVLHADVGNLDVGLLNFLKTYFPRETKEKQKENEHEVVLEQWRNVQLRTGAGMGKNAGDPGCMVM
ncbi:SPX domain-containing protein [Trichophaea hybrida]|nr:SPX domain-containing protein [Trichophaea hybrida]